MKEFIELKMREIFEEFKQDIKNMTTLCELKEFKFNSVNVPDYNKDVIQRYYLLRYLPAYLLEYYIIYWNIFNMNFIRNNLNVLSIGAGCGIDFWGLRFAANYTQREINLKYTGLDIVDWLYWDNMGCETCWYLNDDIRKMKVLCSEEYNIIIFPKSIGELDSDTFINLKNVFANTNFTQDKIIVASSIRKSRLAFDMDRFKEILNIFETCHNFDCLDSKELYFYYEKDRFGNYPKLEHIFGGFTYPEDIRDFMINLNKNCKTYINNGFKSCKFDCTDINRYPITRASQIEFQIMRLERRRV